MGLHLRTASILGLLSCLWTPAFATQETSGEIRNQAAITFYNRYLTNLHQICFDFQETIHEHGAQLGPQEKMTSFARGTMSVRNEEFRYHQRSRYIIWNDGQFNPHDMEIEEVQTSGARLHLQAFYPTMEKPFELSKYPSSGGHYSVNDEMHSPKLPLGQQNYTTYSLYGCVPSDGERDIRSILQSSQNTKVSRETIEGQAVIQITTTGQDGTYSLSLDPAADYLPRKIQVHKTAESRYYGKPLKDFPIVADPGDRHPHERLTEYRFEMDHVRVDGVEGSDRRMISGFEVRDIEIYQSGATFVQRGEVKLSKIRFECADADLKPVMPIPNGTQVSVTAAPGILAEWRNGAVVKIVDQQALKRLQGLSGTSTPGWRRYSWFIVLNGVIALLAWAWTWTARRRAGASAVPQV